MGISEIHKLTRTSNEYLEIIHIEMFGEKSIHNITQEKDMDIEKRRIKDRIVGKRTCLWMNQWNRLEMNESGQAQYYEKPGGVLAEVI